MDQRTSPNILVIGIGNPYRRDDGVGLAVAREVKKQAGNDVAAIELGGEGAGLLEAWKDAEVVLVVDAVHSGAEPGTLHRMDATSHPLPAAMFRASTHAFSLGEAVELGRALGQLPRRLIVFGVEGNDFQAGTGLSRKVESAVPTAVEKILTDIQIIINLETSKG